MSLQIVPVTDADVLPNSTPSLMPFHISHNGRAPVSRYFRPKPAPSSSSTLSTRSSSLATLVASASSSSQLSETVNGPNDATITPTREGLAMDVDSETQPISTPIPHENSSVSTLATPPSNDVERFIAAFRGRQMYGQAVGIPGGYGGLVLRTPAGAKGKGKEDTKSSSRALLPKAKPKSKTRVTTRRSKRVAEDDAMDEVERDESDCAGSPDDPLLPTKNLIPTSTFSSFTLWTPDIPLDEGKDEYVRALMEWTRLAAEIHSYDE